MATAGEAVRPRIRPRRIIERPRLMRMLDGSKARIRMLIGSAGYGKTTLAEQFAARSEYRIGWVRCRRSSSDIAVISRLLATAGATIIPGCDQRFVQRLSVTPDPSREVDVLAEILAEDLAGWPRDAWIVIDDYHFTMEAPAAERFVEVVAVQSGVQLLIASRHRPTWASSRALLYGEILELGQELLAMPTSEVADVFAEAPVDLRKLQSFANGWPAVIGLASQTGNGELAESLPDTLYDFFAEEVYGSLKANARVTLALFAALPSLDWEVAREVLGRAEANSICREMLDLGLLDVRGALIELHPLARSFLLRRLSSEGVDELADTLRRCRDFYIARHDWDAAFDVIERGGLTSDVETLVEEALDTLLNEARLVTLERWLELGAKLRPAPVLQIAAAELALRRGEHLHAVTLAEHALKLAEEVDPPRCRFRALLVAGQASHIGSNESSALDYFGRAELAAKNAQEAREALWGQLMCLSELEAEGAWDILEELATSIARDDPREVVREAGRRLGVEFRFGAFRSISHASDSNQLMSLVADPVVRASFRSTYSTALALSARYESAMHVSRELLRDAENHRLTFVRPYGLTTLGIALAGLHDFANADAALDEARLLARDLGNSHAEFNAFAVSLRSLLQQGRVDEALALPKPIGDVPGKGMLGEVLATRSLVKACSGRIDEAVALMERARNTTTAIETRVLLPAIAAIAALGTKRRDAIDLVQTMLDEAEDSGALDLLITAYRGCPQLLTVLLTGELYREQVWPIISLAGDQWLAEALGHPLPRAGHRVLLLSKREREVYDLLCQRLTNKQIAACLVISEETVKLHVHHVFDKLGIRSRTALVIGAAQARTQAAPRMELTKPSSDLIEL